MEELGEGLVCRCLGLAPHQTGGTCCLEHGEGVGEDGDEVVAVGVLEGCGDGGDGGRVSEVSEDVCSGLADLLVGVYEEASDVVGDSWVSASAEGSEGGEVGLLLPCIEQGIGGSFGWLDLQREESDEPVAPLVATIAVLEVAGGTVGEKWGVGAGCCEEAEVSEPDVGCGFVIEGLPAGGVVDLRHGVEASREVHLAAVGVEVFDGLIG